MSIKTKSHSYNSFIVFDFETGGLDPLVGAITEMGWCSVDGNDLSISNAHSSLILPYSDQLEYDPKALSYTNLTIEEIKSKGRDIDSVLKDFIDTCKQIAKSKHPKYLPILVAHNAPFDIDFLVVSCAIRNIDLSQYIQGRSILGTFMPTYIDTMGLARMEFNSDPTMTSLKLSSVLERHGIDLTDAHRALGDVLPTAELFVQWIKRLRNNSQILTSSHTPSFREEFQF